MARQRGCNRQHNINRQQLALLHCNSGGDLDQEKINTRDSKNAEDNVKVEGDRRWIALPDRIQDPVHVRNDEDGSEQDRSP